MVRGCYFVMFFFDLCLVRVLIDGVVIIGLCCCVEIVVMFGLEDGQVDFVG